MTIIYLINHSTSKLFNEVSTMIIRKQENINQTKKASLFLPGMPFYWIESFI